MADTFYKHSAEKDLSKEAKKTMGRKKAEENLKALYGRLDQIGVKLSETRSEAIEGRMNSGIEEEWLEDEEYYEGIDDANRRELKAWRGKPLGSQLPLDENKDDRGSTIFLNITRPYVDTVSARMGDMLVAVDNMSFKLDATAKPELLELVKGKVSDAVHRQLDKHEQLEDQTVLPQTAIPQAQLTPPQAGQPPQAPGTGMATQEGQPQPAPQPTAQDRENEIDKIVGVAKKIIKQAKISAQKAENQIRDWHLESKFHAHNRRVIEDAALVGSGVLKGPIPVKCTKWVWTGKSMKKIEEIKPASTRVFYRNFYPDPACGEDIHNGNYTWERDDLTRSRLLQLEGTPGYITNQVRRCASEGPMDVTKEFSYDTDNPGLKTSHTAKKSLFEIWYYYGLMRRADLMAIDVLAKKGPQHKEGFDQYENLDPEEFVHVQVTMVNNRIIKATMSHLQTGAFPYDVMVWQRRMGLPFGLGIARQIRPAQRIVTGAMRHMMDNAGIAGGPMLFIDTDLIQAADGVNEVRAWKIFIPADDAEPGTSISEDAIRFITAPMMQEEMQRIVEIGLKVAEDITGLPLIMQGQTSQRTPNTLGGMNLQQNNASTALRRVAKLYDDLVTEPHIGRYYDHILQYSEDTDMKTELKVVALGSSAMIERDMASNMMVQMGEQVMNPLFGMDPKKWFMELLKMNKLDPSKFEYDDEEWEKVVQNMSQQGQDDKTQIEQMKQEHAKAMFSAEKQFEAEKMQFESKAKAENDERNRDAALVNTQQQMQQQEKERGVKVALAQMATELEMYTIQLKEAGSDARQVEEIKQKLQDTVMKLKTQIQLSGTEAVKPPVEPKGKAKDGKSFQD